MSKFTDILDKINTGAQIAQAAEQGLVQFGQDHIGATQEILQVVGAGIAAESSDPTVQSEAVASAQLAATLVPLAFALFALFKKKPAS